MLNEKALKQAEAALTKAAESTQLSVRLGKARATIEAYLAALPDEGGLVRKLRIGAGILKGHPGEWVDAANILWQAADALEAARAAAPETSDDR